MYMYMKRNAQIDVVFSSVFVFGTCTICFIDDAHISKPFKRICAWCRLGVYIDTHK